MTDRHPPPHIETMKKLAQNKKERSREGLRTSMTQRLTDLFPNDPNAAMLDAALCTKGGLTSTNIKSVIADMHREITGETMEAVAPILQNASIFASQSFARMQATDKLRAHETANRLDLNAAGEMICASEQMKVLAKHPHLRAVTYHAAPIEPFLAALQSKSYAETLASSESMLGILPGNELHPEYKPQFFEIITRRMHDQLVHTELRFNQIETRRAVEIGLENINTQSEKDILELMKNIVWASEADPETIQLLQENTRIVAEALEAKGTLTYMPPRALEPQIFRGQIVRDTIKYAPLKRLGMAGLSMRSAKVLTKDGAL